MENQCGPNIIACSLLPTSRTLTRAIAWSPKVQFRLPPRALYPASFVLPSNCLLALVTYIGSRFKSGEQRRSITIERLCWSTCDLCDRWKTLLCSLARITYYALALSHSCIGNRKATYFDWILLSVACASDTSTPPSYASGMLQLTQQRGLPLVVVHSQLDEQY